VRALATHYGGKRLNSPNDIVVRSDGSVYFTDPPYAVSPEERELAFNGVFRVTAGGDVVLLLDDMVRPNGLAFSPDETILYIADTHRLEIRACDVAPDGSVSAPRQFARLESDMEGGPDGIKVDLAGNLYVAGPGALWVYQPTGELVGTIIGPQRPANLAFGGPDRKTLFLTSRTSVYALQTETSGVPVL
jgi:gluconolactonase